jgi:hypothetical protein
VTPCGGEFRFASAAAKRLASLGALLHGTRLGVGAGSELRSFDVDNAVGDSALSRLLSDLLGATRPMAGVAVPALPAHAAVPTHLPPSHHDPEHGPAPAPFFLYFRARLLALGILKLDESTPGQVYLDTAKRSTPVKTFLNRILGMPIDDQGLLFAYFSKTLDATTDHMKSTGEAAVGIRSVSGRDCRVLSRACVYKEPGAGGEVHRVRVAIDRGVSLQEARDFLAGVKAKLEELTPGRNHLSGFYVQRGPGGNRMLGGVRREFVVLASETVGAESKGGLAQHADMRIQRPYAAACPKLTAAQLREKGHRRVADDSPELAELWDAWFDHSAHGCIHGDNCSQ